jgi:hypothetical protein
MSKNMDVGKQQIIFTYLPGKIFDYSKRYITAKIISVYGHPVTDINQDLVLRKINEYVRNWDESLRPSLTDDILHNRQDRFILIDPKKADSEMYPLIFYCTDSNCNQVIDYSNENQLPDNKKCPACGRGELRQLNFVKIHRCGAVNPLKPPFQCGNGHSNAWALDTRGSATIQNWLWVCKTCNSTQQVHAGNCRECDWDFPIDGIAHPKLMDIAVVRGNIAFYSHYVILLNLPKKELEGILSLNDWQELVAAFYFNLPEVNGRDLSYLNSKPKMQQIDIDALIRVGVTQEQIRLLQQNDVFNPTLTVQAVRERSGLNHQIWINSGQELLESVLLQKFKNIKRITNSDNKINNLGFFDISLITDFPYITATFGFTRQDYRPNCCRINAFPIDQQLGTKHPVFFDTTLADAIIFRLNPERVFAWLEKNEYHIDLPEGTDLEVEKLAYFCKLFDGVDYQNCINKNNAVARLVFGLLHTYSHLCIKQAAMLAGLDVTSLTEYILPRSLTFAIYGNQRFSSSIGAMVSLYEDSLHNWLDSVSESNHCVYDPICSDYGGSCHACTHLTETSCRFFNQNLSRSFLFGGYDEILNLHIQGYI